MNIELTEQELKTLIGLIDVAIKTGGLQVAKVAVPLVDTIVRQVQPSKSS